MNKIYFLSQNKFIKNKPIIKLCKFSKQKYEHNSLSIYISDNDVFPKAVAEFLENKYFNFIKIPITKKSNYFWVFKNLLYGRK